MIQTQQEMIARGLNTDFFCANCNEYEMNESGNHGHCGFSGCRERKDYNPTINMINNCKYSDRIDKPFWLNKVQVK